LMMAGGYALGSSLMFLVILNVGATVGGLTGGWLGDHWGNKRTLVWFFSLAVVSLCMLGIRPSPWLRGGLLFIAGATTIGTLSVIHSFAAQIYPPEIRATGISWVSAVGRLGAIAGPTLGGLLVSLSLPLQQNFMIFAIPGLIAILSVLLISHPEPSSIHV
ncbi:MAG TPA: MFS transporter, partial [Polyangiaceae bacterium]|nr:MFS transporter [Polyangiaceae bacterium]